MINSTQLKNLTERLLNETNLIRQLQNFGEVEITGSYRYDLMTKPDIDIHIYNENELETSRKLIQEIISDEKFKYFSYQNFLHKTKTHLPFGIYISLVYKIEKIAFNIDIWIIKSKAYYNSLNLKDSELRNKLDNLDFTKEQKDLIIKCKNYISENKLEIRSMQVYNAVLSQNLNSIEQVISFIHQSQY